MHENFPETSSFLIVPPEDYTSNTVGLDGAHEKNMKQEGRVQGTIFERMT